MFEVGKKVVCIKTHSQGVVVEGKIYIVNNIDTCPKCGAIQLDVGISSDRNYGLCICNKRKVNNGIHWLSSRIFRPLDESFAESVLENIMEQIREEELIEI